ncbi:hypothetical protein JFL43_17795 [Viridibacillus sp. YIM B01967]|uniref:Uncharacterized protein n=1 Tax=Viridibacillus soli TaxID=2798301 RepID=A0ABS1HBB5_9BACL|nr:hypothetical protein [Viridibacillus soli]MBK3496680.1 hypothetical protein [Viridibacillus soli]
MTKFIDDLAGASFDIVKMIYYFFTGLLIVGIPLILIVKIVNFITAL